ncbi:hypothetical protein H5410_014735 [Solanum commersonii]|uniref:Uncharacterized protein n=1 Tax=Solanum commersonii TaxID=4109 RepID=A0A9J5ZSB9_SOLCO|nr:hypothetical protein H5410_014735 [Solanum commersonii]
MCLYSRTCIFGSNDAYSSKLESAQPKQELKVGHASDVACGNRASGVGQRRARKPRPRDDRRCARSSKRRRHRMRASPRVATHRAVAYAHRLGITESGLHASDNCRQHLPMPARLNCGMCTSGKLHRPTACTISQGLNASDVACAHRLGDIGCGLCASSNDTSPRPHVNNRARCASTRHRPRVGRSPCDAAKGSKDRQGLATHRAVGAHINWATSALANSRQHQTRPRRDLTWYVQYPGEAPPPKSQRRIKACTHLTWHVRIGQMKSPTKMRDVARGDFGQGVVENMWTSMSFVACTHRYADVGYGLAESFVACTHRLVDVRRDLPASSIPCTHRSADDRRGLAALYVA